MARVKLSKEEKAIKAAEAFKLLFKKLKKGWETATYYWVYSALWLQENWIWSSGKVENINVTQFKQMWKLGLLTKTTTEGPLTKYKWSWVELKESEETSDGKLQETKKKK